MARRGLHAVPLREGLDVGGRRARPGRGGLAVDDRPRPQESDGLFAFADFLPTVLSLAGAASLIPRTGSSTA